MMRAFAAPPPALYGVDASFMSQERHGWGNHAVRLPGAQWSRSALISSALDIVERPLMPISLAR
jgi:hypothetical protein